MQQTLRRNYSTRASIRMRRIKRRRRIIRAWCARIIFLAVIAGIVLGIAFLINGLIALAHGEKEDEAKTITGSYVAAVQWAEHDPMETRQIIQTEAKVEDDLAVVSETATPTPEPRISAYEAGEVYYYDFSMTDKIYIAKTVYQEARGESFEGQVAVASVIINRYFSKDPFFKNESIYSVVTQKYQFASIVDVTEEDLEKCPSCMEAVEAACKGWDPTRQKFENGACYFYELDGLSDYQRRIRTGIEEIVIGNHHFHNDFNMEEVNKK